MPNELLQASVCTITILFCLEQAIDDATFNSIYDIDSVTIKLIHMLFICSKDFNISNLYSEL